MNINRYSFYPIDSSMYIMLGTESALIIDPCVDENAYQLILQNSIKKAFILLTHEHFDHISGVNWWKGKLNCTVICTSACASNICDSRRNASLHYDVLFLFMSKEAQEEAIKQNIQPFTCEADKVFDDRLVLSWDNHLIVMASTPGHSPGSCCIMFDDEYCFTGDSLLQNMPTITRLPKGNRVQYKHTVEHYLKKLPANCIICPGHGEPFNVSEVNFDNL